MDWLIPELALLSTVEYVPYVGEGRGLDGKTLGVQQHFKYIARYLVRVHDQSRE